jgi:tetratricopeptide (TPR) repeat protein/transcriptional regulator with XRE-family HTH domain
VTTGPASKDAIRLGSWLRQARAAAGMTQEELAERSGVGVRTIGDLERGRTRRPYARSIRCLAVALDVPFPGLASGVPDLATADHHDESGGDRPVRFLPRLLPAATAAFTGRQGEVAALLKLAAVASGQPQAGVVVISAIDGMAGIGKTALALHAAHLMAGRFPDGQLFADLHGSTPGLEPLNATDTLDWFLRCLGIPPQLIPQDPDARAGFYRDRLSGTRTLIVLDNASSTAQVRPLIPAAAGCLVIVTSRKRLTGLDDAHALPLDVLPAPEAAALFHTVAGPDRLPAGHHPTAARVVALCGYLPLAIRITAVRLRIQPSLTADRLCAELSQEHQRLSRLADDDRSLAVAFDLSYRHLPPAGQAMYRFLGLTPGPEVDGFAAAALADSDLQAAERLLEMLWEHNLLLQVSQGRFQLHDLLRLHARTRADAEMPTAARDQAVRRLLDYYQHTAQLAGACLARSAPAYIPAVTCPPRQTPELASQQQAMAWMHTELPNLTAALQLAAADGRLAYAVTLPAALAAYLDTAGPYEQAIILHHNAALAATALGDRAGLATALDNLGRATWQTSGFPAALSAHQQALDLFTALGDRRGQACALDNLGIVHALTGDYPAAASACQQALDLFTALGDRPGQACALDDLAVALRRAEDFPAAASAHQQALDLFTALGDRRGHAQAVNGLGCVRLLTGDYGAAAAACQQALDLFTALTDRRGQALAYTNLGLAQARAGDYPAAASACQQALDLFAALGDRHGQANALDNLAVVLGHTGDYPAAAATFQRSLTLLQELGDPRNQAEVHNHYGTLLTSAGQPGQARAQHRTALALARRTDCVLEQAQALEGIGEADLAESSVTDGTSHLRQALALCRQLGLPAANRIQARLDLLLGIAG